MTNQIQGNKHRIMYLEKEVEDLKKNQSKLETSLEQSQSLVHFLVKLVNEMKEDIKDLKSKKDEERKEVSVVSYPQIVPPQVSQSSRPKLMGVTFPQSFDLKVSASSITSTKRDWHTVLSEETFLPGEYEIVIKIDSSSRSGIMFGFVDSSVMFSKGEYIGKKGFAFHCLNGKRCDNNLFSNFMDEVEGLERGDEVKLYLNSKEGTIRVSVNKGKIRVMFENINLERVKFAISMNGSNTVHIDSFEEL